MKNALQGGARGEQRPRIPSSLAAAASVYSPPPSTPPSLDCRNDLCGKVRSSSVSKTRTMNLLSFPLYSGFMLLLLLPPKYYSCEASYSLSMDPEDRECISVRVPKRPSVISGNFDCWEEIGTRLRACRSVAAWIERDAGDDKNDKDVWRSQPDESAEEFDVQVEGAQRYRLCFETSEDENKKEDDESNGENTLRLGFNVRVKSAVERALPDTELGPETIRALELLEAATATEQKWQNLQDHFDFARSREAFHTKLTSQIHNRVMGWTIIEAVLVVTMAVGQVCYWKSFFEQRRYL